MARRLEQRIEQLTAQVEALASRPTREEQNEALIADLARRVSEFERTLGDWRERFALTEAGLEFVSVPRELFNTLLRKP